MPDTWTPLLIAVVSMCVLLYGFSKTAMPVAGVLASPFLVVALGATEAAGFMVPLLILGDLFGLLYFRQHADWKLIRRLVPGVLLGFLLTALLFRFVSIHVLDRIIGVLILVSVALELWRRRSEKRKAPDEEFEPAGRMVGLSFGTLAGMTTMAANAGGAAMSLYLIKSRVSMLAFMGTSTWFFFILNTIKLPVLAPLGFITSGSLKADIFFAPAIAIGAFIGIWTFRRMNQQVFTAIALALSAVAAVYLIVRG